MTKQISRDDDERILDWLREREAGKTVPQIARLFRAFPNTVRRALARVDKEFALSNRRRPEARP